MAKMTDAERKRMVNELAEQLEARLDSSIRSALEVAVNRVLGGGARGGAMIRYQPNPTAVPGRGQAMIRYQPNPGVTDRGRAMIRYQPNPGVTQSTNVQDLIATSTRAQVREAIQEAFSALGLKLPAKFGTESGGTKGKRKTRKPRKAGRKYR